MSSKPPFRATITSVVSSRYGNASTSRPDSWDLRKDGVDVVTTENGETLRLFSEGQQSVPQQGWVILITAGDNSAGYRWTLFGMPEGARV